MRSTLVKVDVLGQVSLASSFETIAVQDFPRTGRDVAAMAGTARIASCALAAAAPSCKKA